MDKVQQNSESKPQSSNTNGMIDSLNALAEAMKAQAEVMRNLSPLVKAANEVLRRRSNDDPSRPAAIDENGEVVITSYDVPSNHLDSSNSFKGKDTDVDRFLAMCQRQFNYYPNFYSTERKRVEFVESHLGSASEWYYIFMSDKQKEDPDSQSLLKELAKVYLTDIPDSVKLKRLRDLSHKWGNAVDFVTKFKLYATELNIPEILQLELFEDRVHPLIKRRLIDLEPRNRTIENYSKMLITYDSERDRHWNIDSTKRRNDSYNNESKQRKKTKFIGKKNNTNEHGNNQHNDNHDFNNQNVKGNNYKNYKFNNNKNFTNTNDVNNYNNNKNKTELKISK